MKKRILLFTAIASFGYVILTSNSAGPSTGPGNRTGADGSTANCSTGGCHGSGTGPTVTITVDSGSTTGVTQYKTGGVYTIKIHGMGTSNTKYGFQFAAVSGTGTSQATAGSVVSSSLPAGTILRTPGPGSIAVVEQTSTRTSPTAGMFDIQFNWTAPSSAVGPITFYCTINSVDGTGGANSADVSGNGTFTLNPSTLSVASVNQDMGVRAFPNPVSTNLNLEINEAGNYTVRVYDLNGRSVASENIVVTGASYVAGINAGNWAAGMYQVVVEKAGARQVISVVKQ